MRILRHFYGTFSRRHVLPHLGTKCHDGSHIVMYPHLEDTLIQYVLAKMWIHVDIARYPHLKDIQHIPLFAFCIGNNDRIRKKVIKHNVLAEISVL